MIRPLRVLMYHRVLEAGAGASCNPSVISATPEAFREQMRYLAARYRVLSADEVLGCLREGRALPRRSVLITFDDGCRDFGEVAWPIMREHRLPAIVFVPTAYPDRPDRAFWWDRLHSAFLASRRQYLETPCGRLDLRAPRSREAALRVLQRFIKTIPHGDAMRLVEEVTAALGADVPPAAEVLGWDDLRALAADGVTVAAHTRTHPALTQLPLEEARAEIRLSAEDLEREIGSVPRIFAYPFGDHDHRIAGLVREQGFEMALTCRDGHSWLPGADSFRVRRTGITPRTGALLFRARLTTAGSYVDRWRHRRQQQGPRRVQGRAAAESTATPGSRPQKLAYIMSRFPKLSETFVLNEIVTISGAGVPVEVYPLLRERQAAAHPEAVAWVERAHFHPFVSAPILRAHAWFLRHHPGAYFKVGAEVLRETWGSLNFFVGAVGIFPKAVRFAYEMRATGITHVHAHFATHPAVAALVIHRLTGIPFSFTAHGSDLHVDRRMLPAKVAAAAFVATVSRFNRAIIVEECGEQAADKVHVVHCGVDPQWFAPRGGRSNASPLRLACIASLEEVKGHRYLIEACRLLQDRGTDFVCDLVGDGPLRQRIEAQIAAQGLGSRVRLLGGQPRERVAQLLGAADVAVLASHPTRQGKREGIPVALMEAMAAEAAVVATAISGIPELVRHEETGLLVPSGDAPALAEALERLARDAALRGRLGRAGRERVLRDFDLRTNALALLRLMADAGDRPPEAMGSATGTLKAVEA